MCNHNSPNSAKLLNSYKQFILSASGWRKIFAADGRADSLCGALTPCDQYLTLQAATVVAHFWQQRITSPTILVGADTRPTSPLLLQLVVHALAQVGCKVLWAGVLPIPELAASCLTRTEIDGFFYVSASHNPPGYNGFKFGLGDGKILSAELVQPLIQCFGDNIQRDSALLAQGKELPLWRAWLTRGASVSYPMVKEQTFQDYFHFLQHIAVGTENKADEIALAATIKQEVSARPLGVVIDYNGSARIVSCDCTYLEQWGVQTLALCETPGVFAHDIVPEGRNLNTCQQALQQQYQKNSAFRLGYVPDCDGDRGNLVVYDTRCAQAIPLEAQTGFALCVLSELAYLKRLGTDMARVRVVVNEPTSLRIDAICAVFQVQVVVAETGEANIVQKAETLRAQGYIVRIFGEGSNGGNITYPSTGRDPLNTLTSIIKLLYLRGEHGLPEIWCRLKDIPCPADVDLFYLLDTLPYYQTTSVFEKEALLTGITDPVALKRHYKACFDMLWPSWSLELQRVLGIASYRYMSYEGQTELVDEVSSGLGGLRVMLYQQNQRPIGFFWVRASKTEPVVRLSIDIEHKDKTIYQWLYRYHRGLLAYAATIASKEDINLAQLQHLVHFEGKI